MEHTQMTDEEKTTYDRWVSETKPEIDRYRRRLVIMSVVISIGLGGLIMSYWLGRGVTYTTSVTIGGYFYALYGALLLALQAFSRPHTLALMSMTRVNGNPRLFAQLMKSRLSAQVGICFIAAGFCFQGVATLLSGT